MTGHPRIHPQSPLGRYLRSGQRKVEGWLLPLASALVVKFAGVQQAAALKGPACEIGVHHGRLFILLSLLTQPGELAVAYDLFGRQQENNDASGKGNLDRFWHNIHRHGADVGRVRPYTVNSLALTAARIRAEAAGAPRLFSVDGGHTVAATMNDLRLAEATLCRGGIVLLDDVFNEPWPGVCEGACRFLLRPRRSLFPFAIGGNKVFLTNDQTWARRYQASLREFAGTYLMKTAPFFAQEVVVVYRAVSKTQKTFLAGVKRELRQRQQVRSAS